MNYIAWQYIFVFFVIASLICISSTIILSIRYRLISLIKSDVALKKDEKKFNDTMYSVDKIISDKQNVIYPSENIRSTEKIDIHFKPVQKSDCTDKSNEITELIEKTDFSVNQNQLVNNHSSTVTDDISSENTVIADQNNTGTVIASDSSNISQCKIQDNESFILIQNIIIANGKTDQIKRFR